MEISTISSVEDLKKSICSIDAKLSKDNVDPLEELQIASSWIHFCRTADNDVSFSTYLFQEGFPKLARSVLKRKYANTASHHDAAKMFLLELVDLLAENIPKDIEGIFSLLPELMDPSQPFYIKYGFAKPGQITTKTIAKMKCTPHHLAFLEGLDVNSVVDYEVTPGRWVCYDVVRVDHIRRDECEIVDSENGTGRVTINFGNDGHRIAPAFSKSNNLDLSPLFADAPSESPLDISAPTVPTMIEPVDGVGHTNDSIWLLELTAGDVVDACDKSNVWYQACILDVKYTENISQQVATNVSGSNYHHSNKVTSSALDITEIPCANHSSDGRNVKQNRGVVGDNLNDVSTSPSAIRFENVHINDESARQDIQPVQGSVRNPILVDDKMDVDMEPSAVSDNGAVTQQIDGEVKTCYRIAFLGCPERQDEWIDATSGRIRPLNTMSDGHRGDFPIREEVVFMADGKVNIGASASGSTPSSLNEELILKNYAVLRDSCFHPPYYIALVNNFGNHNGFENIFDYLQNKKAPTTKFSTAHALDAVITVGKARQVLSKGFLSTFAPGFIQSVVNILMNMEAAELRNILVEKIEAALNSIDGISIAHHGRNVAAGSHEIIWLKMSLFILGCPFLNKRLGGLKMLTELMTRAINGRDYPQGYKDIRQSDNGQHISRKVIPILYSLKPSTIANEFSQSGLLRKIFSGEQAHYSLIERSAEFLRLLAAENLLENKVFVVIWRAGYEEKKLEAFHVLVDLIRDTDLEVIAAFYNTCLDNMDVARVTVELVNIVHAIGFKMKQILMRTSFDSDFTKTMDENNAFVLHSRSIKYFLNWVSDNTSISSAVVSAIMIKLEILITTGAVVAEAIKNPAFPWFMQWRRTEEIMEWCHESMQQNVSFSPAVKLLQASIHAWPTIDELRPSEIIVGTPREYRTRSDIANHLEQRYKTMNRVTKCISYLRQQLDKQSSAFLEGSNLSTNPPLQNVMNETMINKSRKGFSELVDDFLNFFHSFVRCSNDLWISRKNIEIIWESLGAKPITQTITNILLTFISRTVLSARVITLNKPLVTFADSASTIQETAMSTTLETETVPRNLDLQRPLLSKEALDSRRSPTRKEFSLDCAEVTTTVKVTNFEEAHASKPSQRTRSAVIQYDTVKWIFENLLSDTKSFIPSPFFSVECLKCVEKFWRRLNSENRVIQEKKDSGFLIIGHPKDLIGTEIFFNIILQCQQDSVANSCAKTLTSLPTKLSSLLVSDGQIITIRDIILDRCVKELELYSAPGSCQTRLGRLLMLLDGLLEESSIDSSSRFSPHGSEGTRNTISLNLTITSKDLKYLEGKITVEACANVGKLLDTISLHLREDMSNWRVVAFGKELKFENPKKLISALNIVNDTSLMCARRPPKAANSAAEDPSFIGPVHSNLQSNSMEDMQAINANEIVSSKFEVPTLSLPAAVLSNSSNYFALLFNLVESSRGEDCDKSWALIGRLPTAPFLLKQWLSLGPNDSIRDKLKANSIHTMDGVMRLSIPRLLYNLQIIKILMQWTLTRTDIQDNLSERKGVFSNEVGIEQVIRWPFEQFFPKQGVRALTELLDDIFNSLSSFTSTHQPVGVTVKILLQTLQLVLSMTTPIHLLLSYSVAPGIVVSHLYAMDSKLKPVAINNPFSDFEALKSEECEILASKWGWMWEDFNELIKSVQEVKDINKDDEFPVGAVALNAKYNALDLVEIISREIKPSQTQQRVVLLIATMRRLSHHINLDLSNDKNDTENLNTIIMASLSYLSILWGCVVAVEPSVTLKFQEVTSNLSIFYENYTNISNEILLDESNSVLSLDAFLLELCLGLVPKAISEPKATLKNTLLIGIWGSNAILSILNLLLLTVVTHKSNDTFYSCFQTFRNRLFLSALNLKPRISLISISTEFVPESYASLFKLLISMTKRLESACLSNSSESIELYAVRRLLDTSTLNAVISNLYDELVSAHSFLTTKHNSGEQLVKLPHADQVLQLFANLFEECFVDLDFGFKEAVMTFTLESCLGICDTSASVEEGDIMSSGSRPIVCLDEDTRGSAYQILTPLSNAANKYAENIFDRMTIVHNKAQPPTTWLCRPERDSRSPFGYVGLRNLGCTCYMNSLLQVLFSIPRFKHGVLAAPTIPHTNEEEKKNDYLLQLQNVFLHLNLSEKKQFSAEAWAFANKEEDGFTPINVMNQQDVQEFLQLFCDRLENSLAAVDKYIQSVDNSMTDAPPRHYQNLINACFGGKLANLMILDSSNISRASSQDQSIRISSPTPHVSIGSAQFDSPAGTPRFKSKNVREQEESFVCISLDVKGCRSLEESLNKFVQSEVISDYQWSEDQPRASIIKSQCISNLSESVIFHLKRFELNYTNFRREKLNDYFAFPMSIDLRPYTREHILKTQNIEIDYNEPQVSDESHIYEVAGVIIHSGTSDSGHYYSYIREQDTSTTSGPDRKWFQFDDGEIRAFDLTSIENEWFGGMTTAHEYSTVTMQPNSYSVENQKSAYMLVYHRMKTRNLIITAKSMDVIADSNDPSSSNAPYSISSNTGISQILDSIKSENEKHGMMVRLFSYTHLNFNCALYQDLQNHFSTVNEGRHVFYNISPLVQIESFKFLCTMVNRCAYVDIIKKLSEHHVNSLDFTLDKIRALYPQQAVVANRELSNVSMSSSSAIGSSKGPPGTAQWKAPHSKSVVSGLMDTLSWGKNKLLSSSTHNSTPEQSSKTTTSAVKVPPSPEKSLPQLPSSASVSASLLSTANVQSSVYNIEAVDACIIMLLDNFDTMVIGNLFAPELAIRGEFSKIFLKLLTISVIRDGSNNISSDSYKDEAKVDTMSNASYAVNVNSKTTVNTTEVTSEEDDLALALKLSTEAIDAPVPSALATMSVVSISQSSESKPQSKLKLTSRFLVELSKQSRIVLIAENWRRAESICWLILQLSKLDWSCRWMFIKREMISQLIDIVLGDQSPLCGRVYMQGSRKRAPNSYVLIGPPLNNGELPAAAKNIPNWDDLIRSIVYLTTHAKIEAGRVIPPSIRGVDDHCPFLDFNCKECCRSRIFLATALRQARYASLIIPMVVYLCFDNIEFSACVAEVITEALGLSFHDSCAHIFELYDNFIGIADSYSNDRVKMTTAGLNSIIDFLHSWKDSPGRLRDVNVMMYSFLVVISRHIRTFKDVLATPVSHLSMWAPWMLKFAFQYKDKCANDRALSSTLSLSVASQQPHVPTSAAEVYNPGDADKDIIKIPLGPQELSATSTSAAPKGPYVIVFGDTEYDRELSWETRSERTFDKLRDVIIALGGNIDELIPTDTFTPTPAMDLIDMTADKIPELIPAECVGVSSKLLSDAMTDEELAQYLAQNGDFM